LPPRSTSWPWRFETSAEARLGHVAHRPDATEPVGIDEEEVGKQLETEGVDKVAASYQAMLDTIEAKRAKASG
jgi:hypothetical protein